MPTRVREGPGALRKPVAWVKLFFWSASIFKWICAWQFVKNHVVYNEEFQKMQLKLDEAAYLHEHVMDLESMDSEHRKEQSTFLTRYTG